MLNVKLSFISGFFTHNLLAKCIALILAVMAWIPVHYLVSSNMEIENVEIRINVPDNYVILNERGLSATLEISASEKMLQEYSSKDFVIRHDITLLDIPQNSLTVIVPLREKDVKGPRGIWIRDIKPPREVKIQLDKVITQTKPIKVVTKGTLKKGYKETVKSMPASINVTGPESIVRQLKEVPTQPIVLDETMTETFFMSSHPIDISNTFLKTDFSAVEISVGIEYENTDRTLSTVPVRILQPSDLQTLVFTPEEPLLTDVTLSGNFETLQLLSNLHLTVYADFSNIVVKPDVDTYDVPIQCFCSIPNLSVRKISPSTIKFKLTKPPEGPKK